MKTLNKVLIGLAAFTVGLTVADIMLFAKTGSEPSTLIVTIGGAIVAELIICCRIKMGKIRTRYKDEEKEE